MPDQYDAMLPQMATIRGDLRDLMIGAMAQMTKPWRDMPETEQIALAQIVEAHAQGIVTRIAVLTASAGRPAMLVTLDSVNVGESAKATVTVTKEQAGQLAPYTRQIVALAAVGPTQFLGERAPVRTMPDQPALPLPAEPIRGTGGAGGTAPPTTIIIASSMRVLDDQDVDELVAAGKADKPGIVIMPATPRSAVKPSAAVTPGRRKPGPKPKVKPAPVAKRTGSPFGP